MTRRTSWVLRAIAWMIVVGELALFVALHRRVSVHDEAIPDTDVELLSQSAVPDLARRRYLMLRAQDAIQAGDGAAALAALEAARFDGRRVEVYRSYYIANALELEGRRGEARSTLARLWADDLGFAPRIDVAFHLATLYEESGDWNAAAPLLTALARDDSPAVADPAYQRLRAAVVASGDVSRLVVIARHLAVRQAAAPAGVAAATDLAALGVMLTRPEEIDRASVLAESGDPEKAMAEIQRLRRSGTTLRLEESRAEALARLGKREEADRIVLTFVGRSDTLDARLLERSWRWWSLATDTIENRAFRNVRVRRRTGTTRVRVGGRWVDRPVYTTVTRRVKGSLGKADRQRLQVAHRVLNERGARLLELGARRELAREIHARLAGIATTPRRQDALEEHVRQLVEIDPRADDHLQLFWDEGWASWMRRDLHTARERFGYIQRTYRAPNIRRQARYWYARCLEESGERTEAARHFLELQSAPYEDVYSILSSERGKPDTAAALPAFVPLRERRDDWVARAERDMPDELRLAWELSMLGLFRDARQEIRDNITEVNRSWAHSILARIHQAEGSPLLVARSLRQAWPEIGSVEQDRVPVHFLRMFYPVRFHDIIETESARHGLDPALVKGLVLQESAYDPLARSGAGAVGLMQLMPPTAREMAPRVDLEWDEDGLTHPDYNVPIGTFYLRTLFREFGGDPILTLAAYNGGIGNVRRWLRGELKGRARDDRVESIPFPETRGYVKRVILYRSTYAKMGGLVPADDSVQ